MTSVSSKMQRIVVIEKAENNYSAYVPDLLGCVATGDTADAVGKAIQQAIQFHIEGQHDDCLPIPASRADELKT